MENERRDSLPEFDSTYIDQLFSSGKSSAKTETAPPAPAPEKPEPKPAEPKTAKPEPAAPTRKRTGSVFLLLTAAACLLLGFFLGRLSLPNLEPAPGTFTPGLTLGGDPIDPGIADDYASMSTQELVNIVVKISTLTYFGSPTASSILTPDTYAVLSSVNPVLTELEQRPDAVEVLNAYTLTSSSITASQAANALINYYVKYLGFDAPGSVPSGNLNEWLVGEDTYTVLYEYTTTPQVSYINSNSNTNTVLDFDGIQFVLQGRKAWHNSQEPNFWFRVDPKTNAGDILSTQTEPAVSSSARGSWVMLQPYENGWFVFGYTEQLTDIVFSFKPYDNSSLYRHITFTAFPDYTEALTDSLVSDLHTHFDLLTDLSLNNERRPLYQYPAVAELLRREDCISALLKKSLKDGAISALLLDSSFQARMTNEEIEAMHIISQGSGYFTATPLASPVVIETANGLTMNGFDGFHVGSIPSGLKDVPLSSLNCWIYVPLTAGGRTLRQGGWKLEAKAGSTSLDAWILYDSTTNMPVGWIVAGRIEPNTNIWLRLKYNSMLLEKQEVTPLILGT